MSFYLKIPELGVLKFPKLGFLATLEAHNFLCKPPIQVSFETKLYLSLKAFQKYVAYHLHLSKSGRFSIFSDLESNWHFNS